MASGGSGVVANVVKAEEASSVAEGRGGGVYEFGS